MGASGSTSRRLDAMVRPKRRVAPHNEAERELWPDQQVPPPSRSSGPDVASSERVSLNALLPVHPQIHRNRWHGGRPEATIGIEGSSSYGAPLARSAQRAGLCVREVPPHLSRAERRRTRRPGKSDPGDALAIARVTAREANLPPIRLPDQTSELRLLVEAREDLIGEATRVRNRLHAHLVVLLPGYGGTVANLVAAHNRTAIGRRLRGNSAVQAELARSLLARLVHLGREVDGLTRRITAAVVGHPLLALPGAGAITVA